MWKLPKNWWKKPPFLIIAASVVFWSIVFTFRWADGRLEAHVSKTSAILYQLSSDVQNLPEPGFIEAGKTSAHAAGVITQYEKTLTNLRGTEKKLQPPSLPSVLIFWKRDDIARLNAQAGLSLNGAADELQKATDVLKAARKFIEYAPMADLQGIGKSGGDTKERLDRTKSGLLEAADHINKTAFQHAPEMAGLIPPLAGQVPTLKGATLAAWSSKVLKAQTEQINILQTYWPKYVDSSSKSLSAVAAMAADYQ